jgi:hypothetical protein
MYRSRHCSCRGANGIPRRLYLQDGRMLHLLARDLGMGTIETMSRHL